MKGLPPKYLSVWFAVLAIKLALGLWMPYFSDESYYWIWGQHLQLSYFDHPPMVGWLFALARPLEAWIPVGRWPLIIVGHCTLLLWREIAADFLDEDGQLRLLLSLSLAPLTGPGSIIATPDVPMLFFWSLSLLVYLRFIKEATVSRAAFLGACLGGGFLCKYPIVLMVPVILVDVVWSRRWRLLHPKYIIPCVFVGMVASLPVVAWNAMHDWISFRFQWSHGFENRHWEWWMTTDYVGGQLLLFFPPILYWTWKASRDRELRPVLLTVMIPTLLFLRSSFSAPVEANWNIAAHPAALMMAVISAPATSRVLRGLWIFWGVATFAALLQVATPWLPIREDLLKTWELTKYDPLVDLALNEPDFYATSYQMAADLTRKTGRPFYKLAHVNRPDVYDDLPGSHPKGQRMILALEPGLDLPEWSFMGEWILTQEATAVHRTGLVRYRILEVRRKNEASHSDQQSRPGAFRLRDIAESHATFSHP